MPDGAVFHALELPGVREAVDEGDWARARAPEHLEAVTAVVRRSSAAVGPK